MCVFFYKLFVVFVVLLLLLMLDLMGGRGCGWIKGESGLEAVSMRFQCGFSNSKWFESYFRAVSERFSNSVQFGSNFRATSVQFQISFRIQSNFRAVLEFRATLVQFQSNFQAVFECSAISVQFQCGRNGKGRRGNWPPTPPSVSHTNSHHLSLLPSSWKPRRRPWTTGKPPNINENHPNNTQLIATWK